MASLTSSELPELPPDVWRAIARATLAACGSSLGAWLRLRAVSRVWWQALQGVHPGAWLHIHRLLSHLADMCDEGGMLL